MASTSVQTRTELRDLFEFYDTDGDGKIQLEELKNVLTLCAHDIGIEFDAYLEQVAEAVFEEADRTKSGCITFESLELALTCRPNLISELSLMPPKGTDLCIQSNQRDRQPTLFNKLRWDYISNNLTRVGLFVSLLIITSALYIERLFLYSQACIFLMFARASGQCLNFLCSIIVVLVCRRAITNLRSRGFGKYLPLDDNIYFHKLIGWLICAHSLAHTIGHIFNFNRLSQETGIPLGTYLIATHLKIGWIGGLACVTGWILLAILVIMATSLPFSRRLGKFELFYYSHLLYIPFWCLLFVHAPHFWLWFIGPFIIFMIEFLFRVKNFVYNLTTEGETTIIRGTPLPSNVIHLVIKRPSSFDYKPGDWIYVLIPAIAKYEWHPFTISSCPEQDGVIYLHIRAVGEWTRSLLKYYENVNHRDHLRKFIQSGHFSISMDQVLQPTNPPPRPLKVFIDGPYGSPSSQIFRSEHAVLIATGIGVTPFASILQSIVHHYQKVSQKCPKCEHEFFDNRPPSHFKLRKVDFVWINRDQRSFEWFIKLLAELELTQNSRPQHERFLDIHIHLTAMQPTQIKSIGIQLGLYLMHERNKKDLVTGLQTRTKAGRPNWNDFFRSIQEQKRGKVTVFFCGRPQLGRALHRECDKFGFSFRKEVF